MQIIEIFPWNDNFETKLQEVDEQHQKLVHLLNLLTSHLAYHTEAPELSRVFQELADYAVYHFATEEKLWNTWLPDDMLEEAHLNEHRKFIAHVTKLANKNQDFRDTVEEVVRFLTRWLGFHILESDMRLAKIVQRLQAGSPLEQAKSEVDTELKKMPKVLVDTIVSMYGKLAENTVQLAREINKRVHAEKELLQEKEQTECKLKDLTMLFKATNSISQACLRTPTEKELIQICCDLCVLEGGLIMSWIGVEDDDNSIRPVASSGVGVEYLNDILISSNADSPYGRGPTGTAMREWRTVICQDFENDESTLRWRERARQHGWKSSATYPVTRTGKKLCLTMYSDRINFFEDNVQSLLSGLVKDIDFAIGKLRDKALIRDMEKNLEYLASHDSLTGLLNRRAFFGRFLQMAQSLESTKQIAFLFIDLDQFKNINDSLGHSFGDELLKEISLRLKSHVATHELLCRHGGDEFLVAMTVDSTLEAELKADLLIRTLGKALKVQDKTVNVSASIGIDFYPTTTNFAELLKNSDIAMYEAKKTRNAVCVYDERMNEDKTKKMLIESCLKNCIEKSELFMVIQPQVDLLTETITGAEALIRWKSEELGFVSPYLLITCAEDSGMILAIGDWILHTILEFIKTNKIHTEISINLSSKQFKPGLADTITKAVNECGLRPENLRLEVTESSMIGDKELVKQEIAQLKGTGFNVSVDDFGTGYSSLSYLKELNVDELKIDKSFIDNIHETPSRAIIAAIIQMAKALDLTTLAEGVETREQADILLSLGCDKAQGYLFYKPIPLDDFADLLRNSILQNDTKS